MQTSVPYIKGSRHFLYPIRLSDGQPGLIKVGEEEDLRREFEFLKEFSQSAYHAYAPKPIELDLWNEDKQLFGLTMVRLVGFHTFEDILNEYPTGVDLLDSIWMFRRILTGIGFAFDRQGRFAETFTVLDDWRSSVLIQAEQHGLVLAGWSRSDDPLRDAITASSLFFEITDKSTMQPDIEEFVTSIGISPEHPWRILKDFDRLLKKIGSPYYPKSFHVFEMPRSKP